MTKETEDFEGYDVRTNGVVTSYKRYKEGRALKPSLDKGYPRVLLANKSGKKMFSVHRLVAQAFIPNPENKRTVNHINGIKDDNRVESLEWSTHSENNKHAYDTGLRPKLTHLLPQMIKLSEEGMSQQAIADELECSQMTVSLYLKTEK